MNQQTEPKEAEKLVAEAEEKFEVKVEGNIEAVSEEV